VDILNKWVICNSIKLHLVLEICWMRDDIHNQFLMEVGKNVRRFRKEKNFTMVNLAYACDMEYRQIGRIERGEVNTTIVSILRISKVLEIDMHHFFLFN